MNSRQQNSADVSELCVCGELTNSWMLGDESHGATNVSYHGPRSRRPILRPPPGLILNLRSRTARIANWKRPGHAKRRNRSANSSAVTTWPLSASAIEARSSPSSSGVAVNERVDSSAITVTSVPSANAPGATCTLPPTTLPTATFIARCYPEPTATAKCCLTLELSAAGTHARAWHFIVHACARCGC